MIEFFKDIFGYHNYYNAKLADLLLEYDGKISKRSIPLFSHMINAHQIWNARILKTPAVGVNSIRTISENKLKAELNYMNTLKILDEYQLDQVIEYSNSKGDTFSNTIQEMLFQVANHHTHHRAQIISDLRQNGIVPFVSDYIYYKR